MSVIHVRELLLLRDSADNWAGDSFIRGLL